MPVVLVGWGGAVNDKLRGGDEKDSRESSNQHLRRLRGSKVAERKETGH